MRIFIVYVFIILIFEIGEKLEFERCFKLFIFKEKLSGINFS